MRFLLSVLKVNEVYAVLAPRETSMHQKLLRWHYNGKASLIKLQIYICEATGEVHQHMHRKFMYLGHA
jgi:hypothetical protein